MNKSMVFALQTRLIEPGGPYRGRTYGPPIKSPANIQPENTQDTQDIEFPSVSEDEA
jgi:hypothetical protein